MTWGNEFSGCARQTTAAKDVDTEGVRKLLFVPESSGSDRGIGRKAPKHTSFAEPVASKGGFSCKAQN